MSKLLILMATYNGGEYIKDQLQSLIDQSFTSWQLIIRDDLSTDNTLEVINGFVCKDDRISLIEGKSNIGALKNFVELIKVAKKYIDCFDFFMFCDQDDVWLTNKVDISVNCIKEYCLDRPVLVYTNKQYVDSNLIPLNIDLINQDRIELVNLLHINYCYGCTMIFNNKLLELLGDDIPINFINHDHYVAVIAYIYGEIHYLSNKTILYRQHQNNVSININEKLYSKIINRSKMKKNVELYLFLVDFFYSKRNVLCQADNRIVTLLFNSLQQSKLLFIFRSITLGIRKQSFIPSINFYYQLIISRIRNI